MAQLGWTYVADNGKQFRVGLYHGPNSGHVVVHCNRRVVLIDFNVLDTKSYPLFLDDELFELVLENNNGTFSYRFEIDKEVDTPRNQKRKKTERKHLRQTVLVFVSIVVAVVALAVTIQYFGQASSPAAMAQLRAGNGVETIGRIERIDGRAGDYRLRYSFVAGNEIGRHTLQLDERTTYPVSPLGFPVQVGDEFKLFYIGDGSLASEIRLDQPTEDQIDRYQQMALEKQLRLHPNQTTEAASCSLRVALDIKGAAGLADFYQQDTAPDSSPVANQQTYQRLVRDLPFKNEVERVCP